MSLTYWVVYRDATGRVAGREVPVDSPLDGPAGRAKATEYLADLGVDRPQITGWALRHPNVLSGVSVRPDTSRRHEQHTAVTCEDASPALPESATGHPT